MVLESCPLPPQTPPHPSHPPTHRPTHHHQNHHQDQDRHQDHHHHHHTHARSTHSFSFLNSTASGGPVRFQRLYLFRLKRRGDYLVLFTWTRSSYPSPICLLPHYFLPITVYRSPHSTPYSLLPTPHSLLPTPYFLLPTPYSLLPTPYSLHSPLVTHHSLLPTPYAHHSPLTTHHSPLIPRATCSYIHRTLQVVMCRDPNISLADSSSHLHADHLLLCCFQAFVDVGLESSAALSDAVSTSARKPHCGE